MEIVAFVRELLQRKRLVAGLLALAFLAAFLTAFKVGSGGIERRSVAVGAATSQILVDSAESTLVKGAGTDQLDALGTRALVYAQYLSSREAVGRIGAEIGVDPAQISANGPFSQGTGLRDYQEQGAESRATALVEEGKEYRLVFQAQEGVPIITVYATGPDTAAALALAGSSFNVLSDYIAELKRQARRAEAELPPPAPASASSVPLVENIVVRELGSPEGGVVGGSTDLVLMVLAFVGVFGAGALVVAAVGGFQRQWRLAGAVERLESERDAWPIEAAAAGGRPAPERNGKAPERPAPRPERKRDDRRRREEGAPVEAGGGRNGHDLERESGGRERDPTMSGR